MLCSLARALSLAPLFLASSLLAAGCMAGDRWEENPGCAMVCSRTAECLATPEAEGYCFSQCASAASGAGELGQNVVDACAGCVMDVDCGGLLSGECAASCPHGLFGGIAGAEPPSGSVGAAAEPPGGP